MSLDLANTCTKSRELTRYLWIKEEKEAGASEKLPSSSFGWSKQEFNGPSSWRFDEIVVTWAGVQVTLFCPPVKFLMCCRQRLALGKECTKLIPEDVSHGEDSETHLWVSDVGPWKGHQDLGAREELWEAGMAKRALVSFCGTLMELLIPDMENLLYCTGFHEWYHLEEFE